MASNDIISTNVPSKVPTTDTEEYPVQHPHHHLTRHKPRLFSPWPTN